MLRPRRAGLNRRGGGGDGDAVAPRCESSIASGCRPLKYHPGIRHIFSIAIHPLFPNPNQKCVQSDSGRRSGTGIGTHFTAISKHTEVKSPAQSLNLESVPEPTRTTSASLWHETNRSLTKAAGCRPWLQHSVGPLNTEVTPGVHALGNLAPA